ncbi:MAG: alkaline phosphatase PhoX [Planctomycetota bacterium]
MQPPLRPATRRDVLRCAAFGSLGLALATTPGCATSPKPSRRFGPLQAPDAHGLQLPAGFSARVVATSGQAVGATGHRWHADPDGGATFATEDGGWVYVSNAESRGNRGGVGALRFAPDGELVDAYSILSGTNLNCAGGPTPWGTWLSCEEHPRGRVYECDPLAPGSQGELRPALGTFQHEAAAVDPERGVLYLTEDQPDGRLYRFRPAAYPDLSDGQLEVAEIDGNAPVLLGEPRPLRWHPVGNPGFTGATPTREQVPESTVFRGGEGCWYEAGQVWISTKHDNRVWKLDLAAGTIETVYDLAATPNAPLSGVDNVFVAPGGDVYVAEDGGDMEVVALTPAGGVEVFARVANGVNSEVTGPALSPDGSRMYFSDQRNPGRTFEVRGPFLA